jgi:hypothetical protein
MAATTLLAAGLLVSTLDFEDLPLAGLAVFLLLSVFFSIAILVCSKFNLTSLRGTLVQAEGQTLHHASPMVKYLKTLKPEPAPVYQSSAPSVPVVRPGVNS